MVAGLQLTWADVAPIWLDKVHVMGRNATRKDHDTFCRTEGWTLVRNARGKKVGHHVTYEMPLPNGDVLRTRISRPVSKDTYGKSLWGHILKEQLMVSEEEFWACVNNKVLPNRPGGPGGPLAIPASAIPAGLVQQLLAAGVPPAEIANLDKETAASRLAQLRSMPT